MFPLRLEHFDESFCLAVGLGFEGSGPFGFQTQHDPGMPPLLGEVSTVVIGDYSAANNALAVELIQRPELYANRFGFARQAALQSMPA